MDAHVISFEASNNNNNFIAAVGPDVYDIHSSRVVVYKKLLQQLTQ